MQKATILDVAKLANVSLATVSRALDKYKQASMRPETRERVLAAAAQLRYRPSPMAQQLKARKSRAVCLSFLQSPDVIENPIGAGQVTLGFNDALTGVQSVLKPNGYRVEPFFSITRAEAELALPEMYHAGYFDAAIFPHMELNDVAEQLARDGCLVIGSQPAIEGVPNLVEVPSRSRKPDAMMPMLDEVIRQGRTNLLFTWHHVPELILRTFAEKYAKEIEAGQIRYEFFERGDRSRPRYVSGIVEAVLSRPIDAVITYDEFFGWEVFKALHQCGIDVPGRVTITGAADVRHIFKPLPILQLQYAEKAQQMRELASRLVEVLASQNPNGKFVIPPPLKPYRTRIQNLNPAQFVAASRAELCREHLQGEVEAEILGQDVGNQ